MASKALAGIAARHENAVWVFEDSEARPGDPWLSATRSVTRVYGTEVYHIARAITPDGVGDAMSDAESSWSLIGGLVDRFSGWEHPAEDRITDMDMQELVLSTVAIVVSAFDGEGYVIWAAQV
jgi:hypothetical protein